MGGNLCLSIRPHMMVSEQLGLRLKCWNKSVKDWLMQGYGSELTLAACRI